MRKWRVKYSQVSLPQQQTVSIPYYWGCHQTNTATNLIVAAVILQYQHCLISVLMSSVQGGTSSIPTDSQADQGQAKQSIHMYQLLPRCYNMLPRSQLAKYQRKARVSLQLRDMSDYVFYCYGMYIVLFSGRTWFKLTSHPGATLLRMIGLIIVPEMMMRATASHLNYNLYNNNKHIFAANFTPDEISRIDFQSF